MKNGSIKDFYETSYHENERELFTPIEFLRSREIISRYLAPEMTIADIGGGPGAYAFWLAELGHFVHLLDLVNKHIRQAREKSLKTGIDLASYTCADARTLPYEDKAFDMVLQMGALYHLMELDDRMQCLHETMRVLKDGGIAICAFISR